MGFIEAFYGRRTSQVGKEDAISIPSQLMICKQKYPNIEREYIDDGVTASIDESKKDYDFVDDQFCITLNMSARHGLCNLLNDCKAGLINRIVIWKYDRLSRNAIFLIGIIDYLKRHNIEVVAVEDSNESIVVMMMSVLGQIEASTTSKRVNLAIAHKFDNGLYFGKMRKFGYAWAKVSIAGKNYKTMVINQKEVELIKDVYSDIYYRDVCNKWNLDIKQYYRIRSDIFYAGYLQYEGKIKKGVHTPIIDLEHWKRVNPAVTVI